MSTSTANSHCAGGAHYVKERRTTIDRAELIQRLKVRDVMTSNLVTVPRDATMQQAQELMRQKKISSVPVEEKGRLFGLVSIDDIIRALVAGTIHESCGRHMTTKLVVLEDDMPLSFALRYFDRYHYGRFPVINRDRQLVGIICHRDINRALLVELTQELHRLEGASLQKDGDDGSGSLYLLRANSRFVSMILRTAPEGRESNQAGVARKETPPKIIRRIAVAAYELESTCVHSDGGGLVADLERTLQR